MPTPTDVRAMLAAAFELLPLRPGVQARVDLRVELLAPLAMAGPGAGRATPKFRDANRATCAKELKRLELQAERVAKLSKKARDHLARARAAKMLLDTVRDLHQPTILALGDVGILGQQRQSLEKVALHLVKAEVIAEEAERGFLQLVASRARLADVSNVSNAAARGRPVDNLAMGVIRILHGEFEPLTGKRPARTVKSDQPCSPAAGDFFNFVRDVFLALRIDANPEAYVRAILKERKPVVSDKPET